MNIVEDLVVYNKAYEVSLRVHRYKPEFSQA